jgi:hypothetical protein
MPRSRRLEFPDNDEDKLAPPQPPAGWPPSDAEAPLPVVEDHQNERVVPRYESAPEIAVEPASVPAEPPPFDPHTITRQEHEAALHEAAGVLVRVLAGEAMEAVDKAKAVIFGEVARRALQVPVCLEHMARLRFHLLTEPPKAAE